MPERERDDDFRFEILEHIGVVGKYRGVAAALSWISETGIRAMNA